MEASNADGQFSDLWKRLMEESDGYWRRQKGKGGCGGKK